MSPKNKWWNVSLFLQQSDPPHVDFERCIHSVANCGWIVKEWSQLREYRKPSSLFWLELYHHWIPFDLPSPKMGSQMYPRTNCTTRVATWRIWWRHQQAVLCWMLLWAEQCRLCQIVYFLYFIVCIMATGAYLCVCVFFVFFVFVFLFFFVYMLAASVFYGWPALLTFGFSGNPALLLLVLNCHDCCLFESNKYLLLLLLLPKYFGCCWYVELCWNCCIIWLYIL